MLKLTVMGHVFDLELKMHPPFQKNQGIHNPTAKKI
jgi:hypothetical protein